MTTILQLIPSLETGGAEQACVDVTEGLKAAGYRALVVSSGGSRVAEILKAGGEHITQPVNSKNPLVMISNALWLSEFIQKENVNIIHVRSRAPAWSAFWATHSKACSFVTTNHAAYKFSNIFKKYYNSVMTKADRVIAISDFITKHITENYQLDAAKIRTIPRGIDLDKFAIDKVTEDRREALRKAWGVKKGQHLLLLPSRLSPIKGQALLIEAMTSLPAGFKNLTAVILGHDQGRKEYRRELEHLIAAKGLSDRVKLVAHCSDMPAAYSLASLVVAPSLVAEGFGRVPVEAMIMGVPIVAADLGGFTETIRHGQTGWLFTPHDPENLAFTITKALDQSDEERVLMIETAMHQARLRYDKRKMVADTIAVYNELI